jgi:hypothetical protein
MFRDFAWFSIVSNDGTGPCWVTHFRTPCSYCRISDIDIFKISSLPHGLGYINDKAVGNHRLQPGLT